MPQDYGTIKIPRDAYERHNERRKRLGLTWVAYIDGEAVDPPDAVDEDALATAITDDLVTHLPPRIADELR